MLPSEARRIIESVARGIHPEAGDLLLPEGDFPLADVRVALLQAARVLATAERREIEGESGPTNAWKAWSEEEDQSLLENFDNGANLEQIVQIHQRTKGAIAARLVRRGRIAERSEVHVRGNGTN